MPDKDALPYQNVYSVAACAGVTVVAIAADDDVTQPWPFYGWIFWYLRDDSPQANMAFLVGVFSYNPADPEDSSQDRWYVDLDRDGYIDDVLDAETVQERYQNNVCNVVNRILGGG